MNKFDTVTHAIVVWAILVAFVCGHEMASIPATFSVDAVNQHVGIGVSAPLWKYERLDEFTDALSRNDNVMDAGTSSWTFDTDTRWNNINDTMFEVVNLREDSLPFLTIYGDGRIEYGPGLTCESALRRAAKMWSKP